MKEITVQLNALAFGGGSIGVITEGEESLRGKKAIIPFSVPGEVVRAEVMIDEERIVHGRLLSVIESSPHRVKAPCPYFGVCGGCQLQHIEIDFQRAQKLAMVQTLLERQHKLTVAQGISLIGENVPQYNYRNRVLLHLAPNGEAGFYREGTGDVVAIATCLIAENAINEVITLLSPHYKMLAPRVAAIKIERHDREMVVLLKPRERGDKLAGEIASLTMSVPAVSVQHDESPPSSTAAGRFSQVNEAGNSILVETVLKSLTGGKITELYSGAGNFTLPLLKRGNMVHAVEIDPVLVTAAQNRAQKINKHQHLTVYRESCERFAKREKFLPSILLDPPRSGAKEVVRYINPEQTREIAYVSCNIATLARDLKALTERGYKLRTVKVLDMFPQTFHVETVSLLTAS